MRLNSSYFYTLKEDSKTEDSVSGNLLVRAGFIKRVSSGIYLYTPMGLRALRNIEIVVREEMNNAGAQEMLLPSLMPEELYVASGRRKIFDKNMFAMKDRFNRDMVLGPTHEELALLTASSSIQSYKDLPFNLYQMTNKYRDETRPRYGLIRVREFIMKDAYSFDKDLESLDISYEKMNVAYKNIFDRLGLNYRTVLADTGAMGGLLSVEFQAISPIGEDTLVICNECSYASNIEVAKRMPSLIMTREAKLEKELIYTPNVKTIEELQEFFVNTNKIVKTLIIKADNSFYACVLPGNRELNEIKVSKLLNVPEIEFASDEEIINVLGVKPGFVGPLDIRIPIIMDESVKNMSNIIVGANKDDYHYLNTNLDDVKVRFTADITFVTEGDRCPECGSPVKFTKGIEIGNIFKLGDKYSRDLDIKFLDKDNTLKYLQMGCYGLGVERTLAAIVEQNNDENGMILPANVAPYFVSIVVINMKDDFQRETGEKLYKELSKNVTVILDDRDERAGVKFNDADLIGTPYKIVIGKKINEGLVEFKSRIGVAEDISISEIVSRVNSL